MYENRLFLLIIIIKKTNQHQNCSGVGAACTLENPKFKVNWDNGPNYISPWKSPWVLYFPVIELAKNNRGLLPHRRKNSSSVQFVPKIDWFGVFCAPPLQGSDWRGGNPLPRKSVESKKTGAHVAFLVTGQTKNKWKCRLFGKGDFHNASNPGLVLPFQEITAPTLTSSFLVTLSHSDFIMHIINSMAGSRKPQSS